MVGPGSTLHWVDTRVDIMARGRAHRGGLEAAGEPHALGGQLIYVRGLGLPAVTADVAEGTVVRNDEDEVWLFLGGAYLAEE